MRQTIPPPALRTRVAVAVVVQMERGFYTNAAAHRRPGDGRAATVRAMLERSALPPAAREILDLARTDRTKASRALGELSLDDQVALVCQAPPSRRAELLALCPEPEEVIPLFPEAELCFTAKAMGIEDASWLMEYATPEQVTACLDLDVWSGANPDPGTLGNWVAVLAETSDEAFARSLRALDPELIVMFLQSQLVVEMRPSRGEEDWQPPDGAQTLDGVFYFVARPGGHHRESAALLLDALFRSDYWLYFRMMQGAIWEIPSENEEWAYRWRAGRLEDLGFPPWERAMHLYTTLRPSERDAVPEDATALEVGAWSLPVWVPDLPAETGSGLPIFRAIARLGPDERRAAFYAFVAVANQVAVADRMPLSDAESTPRAIEKAARVISLGLEHLARCNQLELEECVRRVTMERLFRVGANLDPLSARR